MRGVVGGRVWSRRAAQAAWEGLVARGLVVPISGGGAAGGGGGGSGGAGGGAARLVAVEVALEEIPESVPGLDDGLVKWCREI